jgi:hypothetical protein
MTSSTPTTLILIAKPVWFVTTGDKQHDIHRLIDMIFEAQDGGALAGGVDRLRQTTLDGLGRAFAQGPASFPSIFAFVDAAWQLSDPENDQPGTLAGMYRQSRPRNLAGGPAAAGTLDAAATTGVPEPPS